MEGAEFLGIEISPNEEYFNYGEAILRPIYEENKKDKTNEIMFNTEFVPAENLGVKMQNGIKKMDILYQETVTTVISTLWRTLNLI